MKASLLLFFSILQFSLLAQSIRPALSLTYLQDNAVPDRFVKYHEYSINANLIYEMTPAHNVGLQYIHVKTKGSAHKYSDVTEDYYIAGIFYQYDFLKYTDNELFPEISLNYGNYCPCGNLDPYKKEKLAYFGYGFGSDIKLIKNLYLDLGLHYYRPIRNVENEGNIYSFVQWIVGFSYKIL